MEKATGSDGIIKVENLSYSIGETEILKNINLVIPEGRIIVIIGPSGSGKSTLLLSIAGMIRPREGKIMIKGQNIIEMSYEEKITFRRKHLGVVFQEMGLFDWMNVEENISFPLKIAGTAGTEEIRRIVKELLRELHLEGSEKLYPDQLSGGMQRRVAIARILALDPDIILLDEPTSGLDPVIAASVEEIIKNLNNNLKKTFVIVSHVIETTLNLADYIGVMFNGTIVEFGEKDSILNSPDPVIKQYFSRSPHGPIK